MIHPVTDHADCCADVFSSAMAACLSSGIRLPRASFIPTHIGNNRAVAALSPVSITASTCRAANARRSARRPPTAQDAATPTRRRGGLALDFQQRQLGFQCREQAPISSTSGDRPAPPLVDESFYAASVKYGEIFNG